MAVLSRSKRASNGHRPGKLRVLTASALRINLKDKTEVRRVRAVMQGWQADAWNYHDSVGELRFAVNFKANAMARMRLFVGVEPEAGESEKPTPLGDSNIPEQFQALASQALIDLAINEGQRREMLKKLSVSVDIPGECRILGRTDPKTGEDTWSIRSTDEIEFRDDGVYIREIPDGPQGIIPWEKLDPELTACSRVWVPHPRFWLMADSPMKPLIQPCETLLILRRMDRAEGRSRLNRGILKVSEDLSIKVPENDDEDPEADPFMANLVKALTEPISDEGVASAYAPIVVRGPTEALKALEHLSLAQPWEEQAMRKEEKILGNIATGIDLPKEVVTGIADLNHWSAWQVDDNTFRHHLEPHAVTMCDILTAGYFRPRLLSQDVPEEYARRMVIWYDPTELVTHPDRTSDALKLYEQRALSAKALVEAAGFSEDDMPGAVEIMVRLLMNMRTPPGNLVMAAMHELDPTLTIPPITVSGTVPGVKPSGVDPGEPPVGPEGEEAPPIALEGPPPAAETEPQQIEPGPPPAEGITAAGAPDSHRLSRKLSAIDRDLRTRLQVAANAAMLRQLERAGALIRTKVAKDETMRTKIAHRPNERVAAILGKEAVEAAFAYVSPRAREREERTGIVAASATDLLGNDWSSLRAQFMDWTAAAQKQALGVAARIGNADSAAVKAAESALGTGREKAWAWMQEALSNLGEHLLYNPDPNAGPTEWADLNPDTIVPTGLIRGALGIAGGGETALDPGGVTSMAVGEPIGQIGTGATITELLEGAGAEAESYEWEHGPSLNPFEPHLDLDGTQFQSFDDEALANPGDWPDNQYLMPGDHSGCSCDFTPLWVQSENGQTNGSEPTEA